MKRNRRNYYRVLQVQPDASPEIIKASYRTMMQKLKYHPDLGGDEWNAALVNEAYAVLCDPARRAAYDEKLAVERAGVGSRGRQHAGPPAAAGSGSAPDGLGLPCLFCATQNSPGAYRDAGSCRGCGGPLTLVGFEPPARRERETRRLPHRDEVRFITEWPPTVLYRGTALDLSPTGLRFASPKHLRVASVMRLETGTLRAIARVTHCAPPDRDRQHIAGVRFLTLGASRARGVFVSESA
jgi:hypothetical protein